VRVQRADEPAELDGLSYSADVVSTFEGWFALGAGLAWGGDSEECGGMGAAQPRAAVVARDARRIIVCFMACSTESNGIP
jgi:hypothetical protein